MCSLGGDGVQTTFVFLLPLAGLGLGLADSSVAFLMAVPSVVGIFLFWLGRQVLSTEELECFDGIHLRPNRRR